MESSVPTHLTVDRTQPQRMRDGWNPPSPAFSARFDPSVEAVVMAYYGIQVRDPSSKAAGAARAELAHRIAASNGPCHHDTAVVVDPAGYTNEVSVLYWLDHETYARWESAFEPWTAVSRAGDEVGYFVEIAMPGAMDFETITGSRRQMEGIAVASDGVSADIVEHGYWGSMRDRLPSSQTSALQPSGDLRFEQHGALVRVHPHHGIALIRSGQDWIDTTGEARDRWQEQIQPVLHEGMDFLTNDGLPIGCYSNRLMRLVQDGQPIDKTYGHSWWHSLQELEHWSKSHRTHLKIFGAFGQFVREFQGSRGLRLYHEVSVLKADQLRFEYLGCHDGTGLLNAR